MNMYSQGGGNGNLIFSGYDGIGKKYELFYPSQRFAPRQPYAGELVFAAFSGSQSGCDRKGHEFPRRNGAQGVGRTYIPIDPGRWAREYDSDVIRIIRSR